jgi:phage gp36-like protein
VAYATVDDLAGYIGSNNVAEYDRREDTGTALEALEEAQGKIDSYLSRFQLPPATNVPALVRCNKIVAGYDVMVSLGFVRDGDQSEWRLRYLDELAWLKDVAKGLVTPPGLETPLPPGQGPFLGLGTFVRSDPPRGW